MKCLCFFLIRYPLLFITPVNLFLTSDTFPCFGIVDGMCALQFLGWGGLRMVISSILGVALLVRVFLESRVYVILGFLIAPRKSRGCSG